MIRENWNESWELGLVDINRSALDPMVTLCRKMIREKKKEDHIKITSSIERRELLPGADFVVATIGVGGRRAWEKDVFIPREFGIYQPVGDSVAPGGISRAMRMIPAVIAVAEDIKKLCPKALFFNYSNPMTAICTAVRKETGVPVIGLCHGVKNSLRRIAHLTGLREEELSAYSVGVNHFVIIYKLLYGGIDAWPNVMAALQKNNGEEKFGPLSREFLDLYNAYPASDDRHYSEFTQNYFGYNGYFGKTLGVDAYSFEDTIREGDESYEQTEALALSKDPLPKDFWQDMEGEHEQLMAIIQSILHDRRHIFVINAPNDGSVPSLPNNAVLEMPAIAAADGFIQLKINDFPQIFAGMLSKHIGIAGLTVEAALGGDSSLFREAIWQGGYMENREKTSLLVSKLLAAQKEYNIRF